MTETKTTKAIGTRGRTFVGVVISARMQKTVTVEWERRKYVQKYERYLKARTRVKAHNPTEIDAQEGDIVQIQECRPLSKTKNFVVVKKMGKDYFTLEKVQKAHEGIPTKKQKEKDNKAKDVESNQREGGQKA